MIYQVCREETEGERGGEREATSVAVTSLLAGCVNSTSDLYGTEQPPLLTSSPLPTGCGNKRGTDFYFTSVPLSSGTDRAGRDGTGQLQQKTQAQRTAPRTDSWI